MAIYVQFYSSIKALRLSQRQHIIGPSHLMHHVNRKCGILLAHLICCYR